MNRYPDYRRTVTDTDGETRTLMAQIAPYSFGMPRLVVDVGEAQDLGFPIDSRRVTLDLDPKSLTTDEDVVAALDLAVDAGAPYRWVRCSRPGCDRARMDVADTNRYERGRDGKPNLSKPLCEECFMAVLNAEYEKAALKEKKLVARRELGLYKKGYRWAVDVWVHPKAGGDDYKTTLYFPTRPDDKEVVDWLKRRSRVTDDRRSPRELASA